MPVPADESRGPALGRRDTPQNRQPALRIVIVNDVFHPDDVTPEDAIRRFTSLTGWADAVCAAGADVFVCQRFHRDAEVVRNGVTYRLLRDSHPPRPPFTFAGCGPTLSAVKSLQPSIVHLNGLEYPRALRRLRHVLPPSSAILVQDHGGFDPGRLSMVRRLWLRWGLASARALLVATPEQASQFRGSGLVPDAVAIRDVMEGSTNFGMPRSRTRTGGLRILWVGRLNANKDPLTVLDGFARFATTRSDATITFVYGTAELESPLRAAVDARPGLAGRVELLGRVPHEALEALYHDADVFVLGSRREGSGYAALEAMACGAVPVLTDIPPFRGLTGDGLAGALWKPGDADSLATALAHVTVASVLETKRDACRQRFEACFSWHAIGARALDIYRECSAR